MTLALVCIASGNLLAQTTSGNIRGYVTASGNAPVGDAQVSVRMLSTNETRNATTNSAGFFYLAGLRPGTYELTVRRIGLQPQTRTVQMRIGETLDLNVSTSDVAQSLATVEVTSARAGTETRTSEVGTNISTEQISNLPNFERNVLDLAKLTPGVTAQGVNNSDKFIAAGGQPPEAINVFVDGASYKNDVLRGGVVGQDASKGNPFPQ
ncbi:MAG TPA: carboxypeptidase regulatory-like domain-containing protein, partial [Gemmatimonadaceae bacterium]|nr:carboxypeptidase regulatory-like domain-containing protein [Gemmatimonadaceae bacterium]